MPSRSQRAFKVSTRSRLRICESERLNKIWLSSSAIMSTFGDTPASKANRFRSFTPKPCTVPMRAFERSFACSVSPSSSNFVRTRSCNSAAAFAVKVVAMMPLARVPPLSNWTISSVNRYVLPLPAPAEIIFITYLFSLKYLL